ncbi:MAG: type II secretion system protein [Actinomycetota bacterium]|nr:type II secretion system protein [Actinomycetota bacterium]
MKKLLGNQKGFTIIELMVVMTILAILVTIAIASYNFLLAKANEATCRYNLRAIRNAIVLYKNLNDQNNPDSLDDLVPEYIKSGFEFKCPATKQEYLYDPIAGEVQCSTSGHE